MLYNIQILILVAISHLIFAQDTQENDCYRIKYLDFFGLDKVEVIKWSESDISELINTDFSQNYSDTTIKTNFLIPMIVYQLKEYHPKCNSTPDTNYFNQLVSIYFGIRALKEENLFNKTIEEKIDFMRDDFYKQAENDKFLPHMIFTMDSGPFYGEDYETSDSFEKLKSQKTDFGELIISKYNEITFLTCTDLQNNIIWQKTMTGLSGVHLSELNFAESPIQKTSLAEIVYFIAEGERLTLFLKKDGDFMFYFHSW